jgi:hypothetical protein
VSEKIAREITYATEIEQLRSSLSLCIKAIEAQDALKDQITELVTALRACHTSLNVAFDYDGNVFGIKHNDAVDADIMAKRVLEKYGD